MPPANVALVDALSRPKALLDPKSASTMREPAAELVDLIVRYHEKLHTRQLDDPTKKTYAVRPTIEPGSVAAQLPSTCPEEPESYASIFKDCEEVLFPGLTHWTSPNFFAYSRPVAASRAHSRSCWRHRSISSGSRGVRAGRHRARDDACSGCEDRRPLIQALALDPEYLQNDYMAQVSYKDWQVPLSRRFRSLKLWFTLRRFGANGLRTHIRRSIEMAKRAESLLLQDGRFVIFTPVRMALCVLPRGVWRT
ncbi:hypothetical protein PINS_up014588 [Pythium insidiosum]|nr:hypothetical protein PINS_up014588 [Pythium insidiosum]